MCLDFGGDLFSLPVFTSALHSQWDSSSSVLFTRGQQCQQNNTDISFLILYCYSPGGGTGFGEDNALYRTFSNLALYVSMPPI